MLRHPPPCLLEKQSCYHVATMPLEKGVSWHREGPNPPGRKDACRLRGSLELNKVAGNFHITAGKSVPVIPKGHAHLAMMMDNSDYNFSHRIDHFSFGEPLSGLIYPLDGSEITTSFNQHNFQYFMKVVPTEVRTYRANVDTYQFSVTESNRPLNHGRGSHGVPGIFVKYDLSSLMIRIKEVHRPFWQFVVRMCGIVGGIFSVSGMLNALMGFLTDFVCCRLKLGRHSSPSYDEAVAAQVPVSNVLYADSMKDTFLGNSSIPPESEFRPLVSESGGSDRVDAAIDNSSLAAASNNSHHVPPSFSQQESTKNS
ncbi:endoplasmic reticulum-Golgi intermediate compartment protein 2 [Elysia marginata]|uniref:Endoplasmic reticulum-Golgi intermediate compartment protein 2 n=1 Tax=Elysia marginata TaxID=1093978 RepID=A0AAV4HWF7_9GAST|nr:endoplasmic reticulum-Golgi intermediate compartment protein 2 [Elysia marginata]